MKWEYCIYHFMEWDSLKNMFVAKYESAQKVLKRYGNNGWELCAVASGSPETFYFKRQVKRKKI